MSEVCRTCKAPIVWAHTVEGAAIPLDAEPSDQGNLLVENGIAKVVPRGDRGELRGRLHISQFATCPDAKHWSGKER